jgi:exonuclease III
LYTFNARGLQDGRKRKTVFNYLEKKDPSGIFFLQESHSSPESENAFKLDWEGSIFFSHGTSASKGTTILVSKNIDVHFDEAFKDDNGRIIAIRAQLSENEEYLLCNVYAPTKDKVTEQILFLDNLKDYLSSSEYTHLLLGGDWNTIFDADLDKYGGNKTNCISKYTEQLFAFMESFDLIDAIRLMYPDEKIYTRVQRNPLIMSRIDHWLISSHLCSILDSSKVLPGIKSDHSIVRLFLRQQESQRGKGFWKFNSSLLRDKVFIHETNTHINELIEDTKDMSDKGLRWDFIKCQLRDKIMQYSSKLNKDKKRKKAALEKQIASAQDELNVNPSDKTFQNLEHSKKQLEDILDLETAGSILRSKVKWAEAGEKNTKYFLNLEKRNYINKNISKLELESGEKSSNPQVVSREIKKYYEQLYSEKGQSDYSFNQFKNDYLQDETPKLSETQKEDCENIFTDFELSNALKHMVNGKSPGTTGFTVDFYKFFWTSIKHLVMDSLRYAFIKGELSVEQKRGIITLIPKKDKIRYLLKNWRPITLLNTDYKILTKCLAMRLQNILPSIINEDQTGYMKGRYIGENIRSIADLIMYTSLKNEPGIVLLIDFEKAFDTIKWDFIKKSMEFFNFGPIFIKWVNTIYHNIESTVINNGFSSGFFKPGRGIRQGCPVSPYLFIICVELMAIALRNDNGIKGIRVGNTEFKVGQLADDTTILVHDFESISNTLNLLHDFFRVSGLKLNIDKTEAMCIGSLRNVHVDKLYNLKWTKGPIKTLGITLSNNLEEIMQTNFEPRILDVKNVLNIWYSRNLSFKGKTTVLTSLILPKLLYVASILPVHNDTIKLVDNMILDFFWNKKSHKVNKNVIIQPIEFGGMKVPSFRDMVMANRISWIKRLLSPANPKWKELFNQEVKPLTINQYLQCSLGKTGHRNLNNPFYQQMSATWNFAKAKPVTHHDFCEEIIWYNVNIKIEERVKKCSSKQSFIWPRYVKAGILKVKHLLDGKGTVFRLHCIQKKA